MVVHHHPFFLFSFMQLGPHNKDQRSVRPEKTTHFFFSYSPRFYSASPLFFIFYFLFESVCVYVFLYVHPFTPLDVVFAYVCV